jgi:hypothetical protein
MARITVKKLEELTNSVNEVLGVETFALGFRNGFIYFDYIDHRKDALFNSATTNKELYMCIKAFKEGLIFNK